MNHCPKRAICIATVFINIGAVIKKMLPINAYIVFFVDFFIIKYEKKDWNKKHNYRD